MALFFVDENEQKLNKSAWWKPGIEIFSRVSGWIVAPIIVALVIGKSLDTYFGTQPWIFLTFAALGFLFSCVGIVHVIKDYMKKLKEIEQKNSNRD